MIIWEPLTKSIPKAEGKITRTQAKAVHKDLPPGGHWVTIRGHHVYIVDGKVVAGSLPWMNKKGEVKAKKATKQHLKMYQEHIDREAGKSSEEKPKKEVKKTTKKAASEEKAKKATKIAGREPKNTKEEDWNRRHAWLSEKNGKFREFFGADRVKKPVLADYDKEWQKHHFYHGWENGKYIITHGQSGMTVVEGKDDWDAFGKFHDMLRETPIEKFNKKVTAHMKKHGVSPQYEGKRLPVKLEEEKPKKAPKKTTTTAKKKASEAKTEKTETKKATAKKTSSKPDTKVTVVMDKNATIMKESGGVGTVFTAKHNELPTHLKDHDEITVVYRHGQAKRRVKQLEDMGYRLKDTIYYNDDAPYAKIKQVWTREPASEAPKAEPKKPAKKMTRKEVIHELQNVFGLQDLRKEAPDVAERRVFAKLRQHGLMEKCEKCGGTGETPSGLLCPKCYGDGVQYPKLTAELVERVKEKVGEQKTKSAPKAEPAPKQKVEKITATDAKKLMGKQVPTKYRDALLDTLQHEEKEFSHAWARYDEGFAVNGRYRTIGRLYSKKDVEEAIQKYKNDPKFRSEVHARVEGAEKAEKDAFEADVKQFMDELHKYYLNDRDVDMEVDRRLMEQKYKEQLNKPKPKEEPKQTGGLDDIFGDGDEWDDTFNKPSKEAQEWQKKREEMRRQVVKEYAAKMKEYEDLLRKRLTNFYNAKKKANYKNPYQKMSDSQIQQEMKKIAQDYRTPYGHRLLQRYMIAKQTGRDDWKM